MSKILQGDCRDVLKTLPDNSVQCVVTSPPYYGLRDYGCAGQIGLEETLQSYIDEMVSVFREVRRVLREDGTCWMNLGDSYAANRSYQITDNKHCDVGNTMAAKVPLGLKPKDLMMVPARVALALQADGWYLRSEIIWAKPNPMPESVTDRPTKSHEQVFLLTKSARYFYDAEAVKEASSEDSGYAKQRARGVDTWQYGRAAGGDPHSTNGIGGTSGIAGTRNRRSVWTIATTPYPGSHFAVMPPALVEPCILAGSRPGDTVLDPFGGSGTTAAVAQSLNRDWIMIELNPDYLPLIEQRTHQPSLDLAA